MLSLDNAFSDDEIMAFHQRVSKSLETEDILYTVEPKLDGVAVELTYEGGLLTLATTRGDGRTGEVITENIRTIGQIPLKLNQEKMAAPNRIEVRGEIIIKTPDFEVLNRHRTENGRKCLCQPQERCCRIFAAAGL